LQAWPLWSARRAGKGKGRQLGPALCRAARAAGSSAKVLILSSGVMPVLASNAHGSTSLPVAPVVEAAVKGARKIPLGAYFSHRQQQIEPAARLALRERRPYALQPVDPPLVVVRKPLAEQGGIVKRFDRCHAVTTPTRSISQAAVAARSEWPNGSCSGERLSLSRRSRRSVAVAFRVPCKPARLKVSDPAASCPAAPPRSRSAARAGASVVPRPACRRWSAAVPRWSVCGRLHRREQARCARREEGSSAFPAR
jgi:hypothetical protein